MENEPPPEVPELQALASEMVGDGDDPDLFFVTDQGAVVMVTTDSGAAYTKWCYLAARRPLVESALENRQWGTICDVGPQDSDDGPLRASDQFYAWRELEDRMALQQKAPSPVPADFPVQPLGPNDPAKDRKTCGECGRSWDDGLATAWTPAPSARCPFEYFH